MAEFSFFARNNMMEIDRFKCEEEAHRLFPGFDVFPSVHQGYCSYTLVVNGKPSPISFLCACICHSKSKGDVSHILQFRPEQHALDTDTAAAAKTVYRDFAPSVKHLGTLQLSNTTLLVYRMQTIQGVPYSCIAPRQIWLDKYEFQISQRLLTDFADFLSHGWHHSVQNGVQSPGMHKLTGKVGSRITHKLLKLASELPTAPLRFRAGRASDSFGTLELLPHVLNHGDVLPSNMMVDPSSGRLCGLVDWAEAEYLPFGICLYGLEHLLGYLQVWKDGVQYFKYYRRAPELRRLFWDRLYARIPALSQRPDLKEAVCLARDVGVLLWYGFAWDDGAIDRVVNARDDTMELRYLEAFFDMEYKL